MLKVKTEVLNLKGLENHIQYVNKMLKMKTDRKFQKFIQDKCMETLNKVIDERLVGGTTNDNAISLYKSSNHIQEETDGFIIYNNAKIPAQAKDTTGYPSGQFSIALAFEYGVGIIGQNTPDPNNHAWAYNIKGYNFGWYYKGEDGYYHETGGYQGFEIYRYTADRIMQNLKSWVNEYYKKEV